MAAPKVRKGRRVICHATGIYGNSLDYFKAPDGFYYQTKELYEQKKQESDYYRQVVTRMASYMGYEPGDVFPTVITRGLMQFKHYGYAAVLATMEECQSKIEYALARFGLSKSILPHGHSYQQYQRCCPPPQIPAGI